MGRTDIKEKLKTTAKLFMPPIIVPPIKQIINLLVESRLQKTNNQKRACHYYGLFIRHTGKYFHVAMFGI